MKQYESVILNTVVEDPELGNLINDLVSEKEKEYHKSPVEVASVTSGVLKNCVVVLLKI